jgi:VCBS repeat-containing protein
VNDASPIVQGLRTPTDTLTDQFTYTVRDASFAQHSTTLTITVRGANDAPTPSPTSSPRPRRAPVSPGPAGP